MPPQNQSSYLLDCIYLYSSQLRVQKATKTADKQSRHSHHCCLQICLKQYRHTKHWSLVILSGIPETSCLHHIGFVNPKWRTALETFGSVMVLLLCRVSVKQHITEEKMAAHLSQLHISSDYTAHQPEPREDHQQQMKRLVLCDELKNLKPEPILPSSLLSRLWVNLIAIH